MRTYAQTLPQIGIWLRHTRVFTLLTLVVFIGLEVVGRSTTSDLVDTLGGCILLLMISMIVMRHRESRLVWVETLVRFGRSVGVIFQKLHFEIGIDLRVTPPIPRRLPGATYVLIGLLVLWNLLAFGIWLLLPCGWRVYAIQVSYILYLAGVLCLWGILFLGTLCSLYLPLVVWSLINPKPSRKNKSQSIAILIFYVSFVVCAGALLPLWIVPVLCAVGVFVALMGMLKSGGQSIQFIWRPYQSRRVYSIPTNRLAFFSLMVMSFLSSALVMTACGSQVFGSNEADHQMPITVMFGILYAWMVPGIFGSFTLTLVLFWLRDPSRSAKLKIHVAGFFKPRDRHQLLKIFRRWNWQVNLDLAPPKRTDVKIQLVEGDRSEAKEFAPRWPLRLSIEDLEEGSVKARIERRGEILHRVLLLRGLRQLFKFARKKTFKEGTGFWLAPHLWIQPAMTRDEEIDPDREGVVLLETVGPPYRLLFSHAVRHHLYQVMRSLEVDILFVEDGIRFPQLRRIIRVLFEIYDKHRGQRRAEEIHFQGIPKVRVMLHDLQLDLPFESSHYPEPRYEILGRARVLHIFRDRGDQEELTDIPMDMRWNPAPTMGH